MNVILVVRNSGSLEIPFLWMQSEYGKSIQPSISAEESEQKSEINLKFQWKQPRTKLKLPLAAVISSHDLLALSESTFSDLWRVTFVKTFIND